MAELYVNQGHPERGIAVYRQMLQRDATDKIAAKRLAELSGGATSMGFRETLQEVVDAVPGTLFATVMGFDGIAIESYENPNIQMDAPSILIEISAATQQLRKLVEHTPHVGPMTELSMATRDVICVMRPLTPEYFLAMVLQMGALVGKSRYMMRVAGPVLARELM